MPVKAMYALLILTFLAACSRQDPFTAANAVSLLAQKNIAWPACAECLPEPAGWESSREGDLLSIRSGETRFRVFVVAKDSSFAAQAYADRQGMILQSSYRTIPSPYTAMISAKVECSDEFKPRIRGVGASRYILTAANPRLAFGVCEPSEAGYLAGMKFYFDETAKRVIKIECFVPYLARENNKDKAQAELDRRMGDLTLALRNYRNLIPTRIKGGGA